MSKPFQFSLVIKGVLLSAILALFFSLVLGFLLSFTSFPESSLSMNVIFGVSIFIASFITAYQAGTRGIYYGLGVGLGFILIILILTAIFLNTSPSWIKLGEKTILALVSGGVGGIIGVLFNRPK